MQEQLLQCVSVLLFLVHWFYLEHLVLEAEIALSSGSALLAAFTQRLLTFTRQVQTSTTLS